MPTRTKEASGFTLIELLVAASVIVLVLTSLCGIYLAVINEWQRQQGQGDALVATSRACSVMSAELSQAVGAIAIPRGGGSWAIFYTLPRARDNTDSFYIPEWSHDGELEYADGDRMVFYLSDSTGYYNRQGSILWRGHVTSIFGYDMHVAPDSSWDADRQRGRISPLDSLNFDVEADAGFHARAITVTAISSYRIGGSSKQMSRSQSICLRNAGQP